MYFENLAFFFTVKLSFFLLFFWLTNLILNVQRSWAQGRSHSTEGGAELIKISCFNLNKIMQLIKKKII